MNTYASMPADIPGTVEDGLSVRRQRGRAGRLIVLLLNLLALFEQLLHILNHFR